MAINSNKALDAQNGLRVTDEGIEGPFITGGPTSPVGLDLPVDTVYFQNITSGGAIMWKKYGTGVNDWTRSAQNDFYQKASATAETSTTSTTVYLNKLTITTPSLPLGDYKVSWSFKWRTAAANRAHDVRIQRNAANLIQFINFSPNVAEFPASSGFKFVDAISGVQTLTLDFKVSGSGTTAFMSEAMLEIKRLT
jgi:hypothetical protein